MRLLNYLVDSETVSPVAVKEASLRHGRKEKAILKELVTSGDLDPDELLRAMSAHYGLPIVDLDTLEPNAPALCLVPYEIAKRCQRNFLGDPITSPRALMLLHVSNQMLRAKRKP